MVSSTSASVFGRRLRSRREALELSQEKVGVAIGIDESCSRARISRYELGVHEPALPTAKRLAEALEVPLEYLFCDDDDLAALLLAWRKFSQSEREGLLGHALLLMRSVK